jgi:hypothetical protein
VHTDKILGSPVPEIIIPRSLFIYLAVIYLALKSLSHVVRSIVSNDMVKGKAIPLQAWKSPEGSRGLRIPDSKTTGT